jgi:hypothetical protein
MSSTQSTTDSPSLSINIATLITTKEQRNTRDLISNSTPLQWVQLPDLALRAALSRSVEHTLRHACFDKTGANRVDPNACSSKLVRDGLRNGDNRCL